MNNQLEALLSHVERLLQDEIGCYATLAGLCRQQQQILVQRKVEALIDITKQIEKQAIVVREKEEARAAAMELLLPRIGLSEKEMTLSGIIAVLEEPFQSRFSAIQQRLIGLVKEVHFLNEYNASLIKCSLEYTDYILSLVTGIRNHPIYNSSGDVGKSEIIKFLDQHV
jgi:flagellar biosynthesis/type III secretory pathway chaperone